jgi:cell wall-associated NlpC family hydrolase
LLVATPVHASTVQNLQAEAQTLAVKVDTLGARLSILSEEYDQAQNRANSLGQQLRTDTSQLSGAEQRVQSDSATLRRQAVNVYVSAGANTGISSVLSSSPNAIPLQQTYLRAASGNLVTAVSALQISEHQLDVRRSTLAKIDAAAKATAATISSARSSALGLQSQLRSSLSGVNGQLATALAQQEALQQAAAARATVSDAVAARVVSGPAPAPVAPAATLTDATSSGNGSAAVQAAQSALGVPYVWAGASMSGFDCSGLAMWSWAHAGVSLPHSAEAQYESIEHVSMSDLEPGDLIFYASGGYVYHVVIYAGGGDVIQAETFGTNVMVTPIPGGAYAAGRP